MVRRITIQTAMVLQELLASPGREMYGAQIAGAIGLQSGSVQSVLNRMDYWGWLESRWEDIQPAAAGRPRRLYRKLSPVGVTEAQAALASANLPAHIRDRKPSATTAQT